MELNYLRIDFILLFLLINLVNGKKIKWYGYCHFDSTNNQASLDSLSCGKCSKELDESAEARIDQTNIKLTFKYQTNRFPNEYYCSLYDKSSFTKREHLVESFDESVPLLPYLDSEWLTEHLGFLIERNEIATNINSSINLIDLIDKLKIIEIINFGIENIDSNAFSKFKSLKVLRLPNNDLASFNFASFNQEDSSESEFRSKLIELDLSANKLSNIKIENFMYLNSLKVLNLSCNLISIFDLHLINVISPHLQVLDLSDNYLKKFKLLENNLYFSSKNKNLSSLSLISNLILKELMYLDLSRNLLSDLAYLFSINLSAFNETKYCNLSVPSKLKFERKQRPIIYMNLNANNWHCDCLSYEFVTCVKNLPSLVQSDSCYLNFLLQENSNLFKNFKIDNLNCSSNCKIRKLFNSDEINSTTTSQTTIQTASVTTTYTTSTTRIFKSSRIPYSYDISSTFYWICSICIGIVSISCLFVAWYFCWKKYRLFRSNHEPSVDSSSINSRMHPDQYNQRRNLYFLTNRLNSQYPINTNWRNRPIADPSLFFISLNQNAGITETVFNNIAYINDDPPNYYEAIMTKNRTNSSINQRQADGINLNDFLPIDAPSIEFIGDNLTDIPEESEDTNQSFRQSTEV